jgi:hypothetical protein
VPSTVLAGQGELRAAKAGFAGRKHEGVGDEEL